MDNATVLALYSLLLPTILGCIGLLLLYGVIRVAVARGLRDHYKWVERQRPRSREHVGPASEAVPPNV